jgi:ASC-1-like (ASCH) protein
VSIVAVVSNPCRPIFACSCRADDSFEAMLRAGDPASIAPGVSDPDELLGLIRGIYPLEKEALGVLAIEVERLVSHPKG